MRVVLSVVVGVVVGVVVSVISCRDHYRPREATCDTVYDTHV